MTFSSHAIAKKNKNIIVFNIRQPTQAEMPEFTYESQNSMADSI